MYRENYIQFMIIILQTEQFFIKVLALQVKVCPENFIKELPAQAIECSFMGISFEETAILPCRIFMETIAEDNPVWFLQVSTNYFNQVNFTNYSVTFIWNFVFFLIFLRLQLHYDIIN